MCLAASKVLRGFSGSQRSPRLHSLFKPLECLAKAVGYAYLANYRLYEQGVLNNDDFEMWERDVIRLLSIKGGNQWWQSMVADTREMYWRPVTERLDRLIAEESPNIPHLKNHMKFVAD